LSIFESFFAQLFIHLHMTRVLVEKIFDEPISQEKWDRDIAVGIPCHNAHNVHWIRSMMARDRRRVICEFEAPDVETVQRSFRKAKLPFVRIWAIDLIEPSASIVAQPSEGNYL